MNGKILAALAGLVVASQTWAASAGDKLLRQDIDAIRQDQQAMRKDLEEVKKLLQPRQAPAPQPVAQAIDQVLDIGDAPVRGNKDARLTLMEFSDYQCPFCKRHADATLGQLDKEYIATGKLRYVFRNFPLEAIHANALKAAEAASCAGEQGKYWEMHDRLFANQQSLAPEKLAEHAEAIGLQAESFKSCLDSGKYAENIRADMAEAQKLGISGTPTLLLGISDGSKMKEVKIMRGAYPFAAFKQEIDKLLAGKEAPSDKLGKN